MTSSLEEGRETRNDTQDSALGIRMNAGSVYCSFRQDEVWKLSLKLGTWKLLLKMTKESLDVTVWARRQCAED